MSVFSNMTLPSLKVRRYFLEKMIPDTRSAMPSQESRAIVNVDALSILPSRKTSVKARIPYALENSMRLLDTASWKAT